MDRGGCSAGFELRNHAQGQRLESPVRPCTLGFSDPGLFFKLEELDGHCYGEGSFVPEQVRRNRAETRFLLTRSSDLILDRLDPAYCFRLGRDRITISLAASTCRGYSFPRPESFLSAL